MADAEGHEVTVVKSQACATDFLQTEQWSWVEDQLASSHVILGHTRYPTFTNTVHAKNAQPFGYHNTAGDRQVMMTHNGHIQDHWSLTRDIPKFTHPVDSAHIARRMAESGDPKTLLPTIKGNYALVWYDATKRVVYSANNGGRSLFVAMSKDGKKMYYSSEDTMLKFLLDRCGLDYKKIVEMPEMECFHWKLDDEKLDPGTYFKYKEKPVPVITYGGHSASGGTGYIPHGKKGSLVWVKLDPESAFMPYVNSTTGKETQYGKFYGTLPSETKSLVEVNSCKRIDFDESIVKYFKDNNIPCRVQTEDMEDDEKIGRYHAYRCYIDVNEFEREITRIKKHRAIGYIDNGATDMVDGPNKAKISKGDWHTITKDGCFHCTNTIPSLDMNKIGWQLVKTNMSGEDLYQGVCSSCVKQIADGNISNVV